jgi:hypothetical protein
MSVDDKAYKKYTDMKIKYFNLKLERDEVNNDRINSKKEIIF